MVSTFLTHSLSLVFCFPLFLPFCAAPPVFFSCSFYEWHTDDKTNEKQPYYHHIPDTDILYLAGLWDRVKLASGQYLYTVTVVTTEAPQKTAA